MSTISQNCDYGYHSSNLASGSLYSWSESDCETLMVDPKGEVYLISKNHNGRGVLFHLPSTAWAKPGSHSHRVHVTSTVAVPTPSSHPDPVAGDISPDGNEVLVKVNICLSFKM